MQEQSEEKSPNLTKFTEHFNNMSYWTRTLILSQPDAKVGCLALGSTFNYSVYNKVAPFFIREIGSSIVKRTLYQGSKLN